MQYYWIEFYMEFATKLLSFKNDRNTLIKKIRDIHSEAKRKMPKIESDNEIIDIDPFTIFGMFNKRLSKEKRISLCSAISNVFGISARIPSSLDGVPIVNNLKAAFFGFKKDRSENDIEHLWELFDAAIALADQDTSENRKRFSYIYDKVHDQYGICWNITMGLFWIRPYIFLNLDSTNRWFISDIKNMPTEFVTVAEKKLENNKKPPYAADYLEIKDLCQEALNSGNYPYKNFPELSEKAWIVSELVNQEKKKRNAEKTVLEDGNVNSVHYWLYVPGPKANMWEECYKKGYMLLGCGLIGDLTEFNSKDAMKRQMMQKYGVENSYRDSAYASWQFVHDIKVGDVVFVKKGNYEILGRGIVESDYEYDAERTDEYKNIRKVRWINKGNWSVSQQSTNKTLTDITQYPNFVHEIKELFDETSCANDKMDATNCNTYSADDFLDEVYMSAEEYHRLVALLRNKKNIILQGAPGVGKTYIAKRLAYSMMGVKDDVRMRMAQFHQSYSYEDFIMGFRPSATGFELKTGAFYDFCKKAEKDIDNEYFFIIDEINRGNLSKIFGELFMLLEGDKRGCTLQLLYSEEQFTVPKNVYIIGMMNTADRSLAMLDYALRRRFAFFDIKPGFETNGFCEYRKRLNNLNNKKFAKLITSVENLNQAISSDDSLGEGFCIGHSYFCNLRSENIDERLYDIVEYELIPLLKEYWFDEPVKVKNWSENLRNAIK